MWRMRCRHLQLHRPVELNEVDPRLLPGATVPETPMIDGKAFFKKSGLRIPVLYALVYWLCEPRRGARAAVEVSRGGPAGAMLAGKKRGHHEV
jgi:hypothetical protein